jgi:signal transduction histidine kinase
MSAEVILGRRVPAVTRGGFTPAAMTAFVMLMLLTLSMKEMQTREELLESRRREEELKQLNAVNKEFTRIVAHEINTPLTVASGYAQMLSRQLRRGEENPEMADTLDTISSETRRLSALVAQMLRMSRNAQIQPLRERVNVQTLLSDAAAIAKPVLQKNENFLEIDCRECGDIAANRDAMLQIFMNLADNAGRHTRNGRIKLSAESDGSNVIFRVSDTGSGISRENRDKVFDQGYSPDGRSGIGLAVCRDLVTAYGGVMEIESTGPDGTVFMFTLPLWKEN